MATKHTATAADGKVFKRTSANRVYSHCVVIHIPVATWNDREYPAHDRAEWTSSLALAQKNASAWRTRRPEYAVEILEAVRA